MARMVWTTGDRHGHVHDRPDCHGARTSQHRTRAEYVEMPLADVRHPIPCKRCFPDLPDLKVWHPICHTCKISKPLPCAHNGAILAYVPRRGGYARNPQPDAVVYLRRWVWPENAWQFDLVEPPFAE